jgi:flagellar basal body-associated protein FliL
VVNVVLANVVMLDVQLSGRRLGQLPSVRTMKDYQRESRRKKGGTIKDITKVHLLLLLVSIIVIVNIVVVVSIVILLLLLLLGEGKGQRREEEARQEERRRAGRQLDNRERIIDAFRARSLCFRIL